MLQPIHLMVMKRLLLVWLALSLLLGGIAYSLELAKVNDAVFDLATREVKKLDQHWIYHLDEAHSDVISRLQQFANNLVQKDFVMVEIYKPDETHLVIAMGPASASIRQEIDKRHHRFPLDEDVHYERFKLAGKSLIQVLIPLKDLQGKLAGYFEGVYQVDDATLDTIYRNVYQTLFQVIIILLAAVIAIYPVIVLLNRHLFTLSRDLLQANVDLLEVLGSAIAMRDSTTNSHNYRVTLYAVALGEELGLKNAALRNLIIGAFLHDVGKIGVSDTILQKQHELDADELKEMQHHVSLGQYIVDKSSWLAGALEVIQYHHEKYDGSGYLNGLKGEQIPLNARIFAVVDVFDALISKRPYKKAFSLEQTLVNLREGRGSHFDPDILDRFLDVAESLFQRHNNADPEQLESQVRALIYQYFFRPGTKNPSALV